VQQPGRQNLLFVARSNTAVESQSNCSRDTALPHSSTFKIHTRQIRNQ